MQDHLNRAFAYLAIGMLFPVWLATVRHSIQTALRRKRERPGFEVVMEEESPRIDTN